MLASNSPELIVGNHVLHRRCVARYPPSALIRLTISNQFLSVNVRSQSSYYYLTFPLSFTTSRYIKQLFRLLPTLLLRHYAVFMVLAEIIFSILNFHQA
jgi:hypothetical protein